MVTEIEKPQNNSDRTVTSKIRNILSKLIPYILTLLITILFVVSIFILCPDQIETIANKIWLVFQILIPTLLTLSILFVSIYSSYYQSYRTAELNIINHALLAGANRNSPDWKMAEHWMTKAIEYQDVGERRAYSANYLALNLLVLLAFLIVLLILLLLLNWHSFEHTWVWFKYSLLYASILTTLLCVYFAFLSPDRMPGWISNRWFIKKIEARFFSYSPHDKSIIENHKWLIVPLCNYMSATRRGKYWFGLSPNKRQELLDEYLKDQKQEP